MRHGLGVGTAFLAAFLGAAVPALAVKQMGSWNSDLTCSGFPESRCDGSQLAAGCGTVSSSTGGTVFSSLGRGVREIPRPAALGASGSVRAPFDVKPLWVSSGVWDRSGTLLLADVMRGAILRYSPNGQLLGTVTLSGSPSGLQTAGNRTVVKDREGRFLSLEPGSSAFGEGSILGRSQGPRGEIRSIFNWSLAGKNLLAFGDVLLPDGTWKSGLLRVPLESPRNFEILRDWAPGHPARSLYLLGNPYVASIGNRGYFLSLDGAPALYEVTLGEGRSSLRRIPLSVAPVSIPASRIPAGPGSVAARYSALEGSSVPAGLYAWQDSLFVLMRPPLEGAPGNRWFLARVDPRRGTVSGGVFLPTQAKHLTLVPGPRFWAILEKGAVLAAGRQEIPSMVLFPTSSFDPSGAGSWSLARKKEVWPQSGFAAWALGLIHKASR